MNNKQQEKSFAETLFSSDSKNEKIWNKERAKAVEAIFKHYGDQLTSLRTEHEVNNFMLNH